MSARLRPGAVAPGPRRRGASIVEALVGLLLGLLVVHLGLTTMRRLESFEDRSSRRHDALLSTRIVRTVLRGELARGAAGTDWTVGGDSVPLRAFRGTGVVCSVSTVGRRLVVAYLGDRHPDPVKDSVEITGADGGVTVVGLSSWIPSVTPCPLATASEAVHEWTLDTAPPDDALVARVFESGSYHLVGSALRYRIGAGGRQPLTPEVWRDGATGLTPLDSVVVLELAPRPGYGPDRAEFLAWIWP